MSLEFAALVFSIICVAVSLIFAAGKFRATVDTHGNAIGEAKRRLDAHEELHKQHIRDIATLKGRDAK